MRVQADVFLVLLDRILNFLVVLFFTYGIVELQAERVDKNDGGAS